MGTYKTLFINTEIVKKYLSMPSGDQLARDVQAALSEKQETATNW